jgi:hypothetical protein
MKASFAFRATVSLLCSLSCSTVILYFCHKQSARQYYRFLPTLNLYIGCDCLHTSIQINFRHPQLILTLLLSSSRLIEIQGPLDVTDTTTTTAASLICTCRTNFFQFTFTHYRSLARLSIFISLRKGAAAEFSHNFSSLSRTHTRQLRAFDVINHPIKF